MEQTGVREVGVEMGLFIKPESVLLIHELFWLPLDVISYYFSFDVTGGSLKMGEDREHGKESQILKDLKFVSFRDIESLPVYPKFIKEAILAGDPFPSGICYITAGAGG